MCHDAHTQTCEWTTYRTQEHSGTRGRTHGCEYECGLARKGEGENKVSTGFAAHEVDTTHQFIAFEEDDAAALVSRRKVITC